MQDACAAQGGDEGQHHGEQHRKEEGVEHGAAHKVVSSGTEMAGKGNAEACAYPYAEADDQKLHAA